MNNEPIDLYLEDEAEFISEETGIDYDTVMEYLEAEDDYCDEIPDEIIVLEEEELNRYVVENTDVTLEQAEEIARAEIMYFDKVGITCSC